MIDGAIRLLFLPNQLALTTRRVHLNFEQDEAGDGPHGGGALQAKGTLAAMRARQHAGMPSEKDARDADEEEE